MSRVLVCLAALALFAASTASAQVVGGIQGGVVGGFPGQMPPRDRNTPPATGTSRILGRVVAADSGQALRKAQVRISAPEIRESRVTTTDQDGRYEFKDLPAGRYTLTATKGSYVNLSYGQTRPNEPGRPLEVGENQTLEKIDIALPRGSIITGRVVDEFGEPVADVMVMPMRNQWMQGQRRPMPAGRTAMTNDIGEFRLFGLPPGEYYLSATLRGGMAMMMTDVSDDRAGYAPTYYPGTPNIAEAQPIAVGVGETASNLNVALSPTRTARVTGTVVDAEGRPATGGNVMVMQRSAGAMMMPGGGGPIRPDGTFVVSNLAPGEYVLRAMTPPAAGGVARMPAVQPTANVTVNGDDVSGVVIAPPKLLTVRGRIVLPPAAAETVKPAEIRVSATPVIPEPMFGGPPAAVRDDLTFEFQSAPGQMVIRAGLMMAPGAGLVMKSVHLNGLDVTDKPVDFVSGHDVEGVEIVFTSTPPEVSGLVTDSRANPVKDFTVLLFATDRDRWIGATRYIATARPDQDGRFKVRTLPPGDYYAVALAAMDMSDRGNPEFLEEQSASATRFSLRDAEVKTLDLKLSTR
jgi:protocatechuate 3,4-dioxygenase beta subunit